MKIHKRLIDLNSSSEIVKQIVRRLSSSSYQLSLSLLTRLTLLCLIIRPPSLLSLESRSRSPLLCVFHALFPSSIMEDRVTDLLHAVPSSRVKPYPSFDGRLTGAGNSSLSFSRWKGWSLI